MADSLRDAFTCAERNQPEIIVTLSQGGQFSHGKKLDELQVVWTDITIIQNCNHRKGRPGKTAGEEYAVAGFDPVDQFGNCDKFMSEIMFLFQCDAP